MRRASHCPGCCHLRLRMWTRLALGLAALYGVAAAQKPQSAPERQATTQAQSFEVASLRLEDPNTPPHNARAQEFPSNRLTIRHTYIKSVIVMAYGVEYGNIVGGPDWLNSQHYDLEAKAEGDVRLTREQMAPLLRSLLESRLHLTVHKERRVVNGYSLVIAKGGPKIKPNRGTPFKGMVLIDEFKFDAVSVDYFAKAIKNAVKGPVIDNTGLGGLYDFDLKFTPDDAPADYKVSDAGSIFTTIQEQLGLKLVAQKVPMDFLVIDHVERVPVEN
jgi:uncharacterized protein (TIGR03435 family)